MTKRTKKPKRKLFHRRTPPGAAPGTLVSDQSKQPARIHYYRYSASHLREGDISDVSQLPDLEPGEVLWLEVTGLGDAGAIERVGRRFGLHPLALEDVVHVHQRAKIDEYEDHVFIVARMMTSHRPLNSEQFSLFLGANFVVTFDEHPGDCFAGIRNRLRQNGRIRSRGADHLAYAIIDAIIDDYFPRLEHLGVTIDELDDRIGESADRTLLSTLHDIRRDLILIRKLLWQHREALSSLVRSEVPLITDETKVYLRDCLDHIVQLIEVVETDRESCLSLQELYLSDLSQRTNDIMKVLTLIATLFMPMTFIAGVYGMNFDPSVSPWNMPELKWYFGYPFAWVLMGLLGGGMSLYFWMRGWFRR